MKTQRKTFAIDWVCGALNTGASSFYDRGVALKSSCSIAAALIISASIIGMFSSISEAAVITGLFNTGVDGSHVALSQPDGTSNGVIDNHYQVISPNSGSAVTYKHPAYIANSPTSSWISVSSNGGPGNQVVTFQTTFTLTGSTAGAAISGFWGVDNTGEIFLNGHDTGNALAFGVPAFQQLHAFSITNSAWFDDAVNNLTFVVCDVDPPGALRVDGLTAVYPSRRLGRFILGFLGVGFMAYRRKEKRNFRFA